LRAAKYINHGTQATARNAEILNHWIGLSARDERISAESSKNFMLKSWIVFDG
jgi:hypothetical protein